MPVPFVDLQPEYDLVRCEVDGNIRSVIDSGTFIGGEMVSSFATEMAGHQEVEEVVTAGCCTSALSLTLTALGLEAGDEVITTACTAIPTTEAISMAGGKVVFADLAPGSYHIGAAQIEPCITERTKVILPVHLYGIPCDMPAIMELAKKHDLKVLEDCAQAQGARLDGVRVGNFGDAACFSFFPSKNLGAFGDGGAMTAKDAEVRTIFRQLANHGKKSKFEHVIEGTNSRLDAIQAAVLRAKLPRLDERNAMRRQVAEWYFELLSHIPGVSIPVVPDNCEPVWHIFPIRVLGRDPVREKLNAKGISTGIHYATALHLQPAYSYLGLGRGSLPVSEAAFDEELSLPMFPAMTRAQVEEVTAALREIMSIFY